MLADKLRSAAYVKPAVGQVEYTTPGTYSWEVPENVRFVNVVCIGGGGGPAASTSGACGAGGGGLGWKNQIPVVPFGTYTVVVGSGGTRVTTGTAPSGGASYFINQSTVAGLGGTGGFCGQRIGWTPGGGHVGDNTYGSGGEGGMANAVTNCGGGGGAGGYTWFGGTGGYAQDAFVTSGSTPSKGGGGGGGSGAFNGATAGSGGGTGIFGEGLSGYGGYAPTSALKDGSGGNSGSGGVDASGASSGTSNTPNYSTTFKSTPGLYGGGGSGSTVSSSIEQSAGGGGAVRIIWGAGRAFPSTNTGNM